APRSGHGRGPRRAWPAWRPGPRSWARSPSRRYAGGRPVTDGDCRGRAAVNERPSWPERVLAGFRPVRGGRRQSWALGAVALALAVLIAATLLLASRVLQRSAVPASRAAASPAAAEPPPAISRYALSSPTLGPDGPGWVLERAQQPPHTGETTVWRTVDRGAHWWRQLDLPAGVAELHSGAGDQALIDVTAVYSGPGAAVTALFYSTSDGGAHW